MKKFFPLIIGGILLGIAGNQGDCLAASEYDQGENVFKTKCIFCHGETGMGNGPAASSFGHPPANLTADKFWKGNAEKKITDAVTKGYGSMPMMELGPDQIKGLIFYMSHTFKRRK